MAETCGKTEDMLLDIKSLSNFSLQIFQKVFLSQKIGNEQAIAIR
jgi:hypothetical protein